MVKIDPMWDKFPEIKQQLIDCLLLIKEKTAIENEPVQLAIYELLESGGKLLRPAYFLLFAQLGNEEQQNKSHIITAAASTEVLHLATLIHDDIIDESSTRRGIPTIQSEYGKDVAVYAGDLLLAVHFELLAEATDSTAMIKNNALSMRRVLLGELEQMMNIYNTDITVEQYMKNIEGKTAQLFELSCAQGAYWGKTSNTVAEKSGQIGHHIGIAFQMLDDILDYSQSSEIFAKPVLEDVKQGVYSLPLILALEQNEAPFIPLLAKKDQMSDADVTEVIRLIQKYQGLEQAYAMAQSYTEKALTLILELPDSPARTRLYQLTKSLLDRTF